MVTLTPTSTGRFNLTDSLQMTMCESIRKFSIIMLIRIRICLASVKYFIWNYIESSRKVGKSSRSTGRSSQAGCRIPWTNYFELSKIGTLGSCITMFVVELWKPHTVWHITLFLWLWTGLFFLAWSFFFYLDRLERHNDMSVLRLPL